MSKTCGWFSVEVCGVKSDGNAGEMPRKIVFLPPTFLVSTLFFSLEQLVLCSYNVLAEP